MALLQQLFEIYPAARSATTPLGIRVDDLVLGGRLDGCDPVSGQPVGGLEEQVAYAYEKMEALLRGAGGSLDNVGKATAYVTSVEDREPVNGTWWEGVFPDRFNRPAYKVLLAKLAKGKLVELDVFGVLNGTRTRFDLPGVPARDPTIRIGDFIFSSRCHGIDGSSGELVSGGLLVQATQTFTNLRALSLAAGGSPTDIVQLNAYGKDADYAGATREAFSSVFADLDPPPVLNTFVNHITARFEISVEMVAVIGARE